MYKYRVLSKSVLSDALSRAQGFRAQERFSRKAMLNMHPSTIGGYIIKIRKFCRHQFLRTNFGEDTILKIKCEDIKKV